jgi:hypothetical protein
LPYAYYLRSVTVSNILSAANLQNLCEQTKNADLILSINFWLVRMNLFTNENNKRNEGTIIVLIMEQLRSI